MFSSNIQPPSIAGAKINKNGGTSRPFQNSLNLFSQTKQSDHIYGILLFDVTLNNNNNGLKVVSVSEDVIGDLQ